MNGDNASVTGNSASVKDVREARKRVRFTQRKQKDAWKAVFQTVQGKLVLLDLLNYCGTFADPDVEHTNVAMKAIGKQSVGHYLIALLESAQPGALGELVQLNAQRT
jgi:hypothetical protein